MEVRLRTLEAQRDTDHEHFMKLTQFVESLNSEFIKHQTAAHEMQQQLREFIVSGVRFARDLAEIKDSTNLRFKNFEHEFPDIIIGVVDAQVTAAIGNAIHACAWSPNVHNWNLRVGGSPYSSWRTIRHEGSVGAI